MGLKFGNLKKLSGITFFRLSPHEQRAFAGVGEATGRMIKRLRSNILVAGPFFLLSYVIMEWATEENHKMHRKNPKDYENDV
ncbi:cytochrome b-c1 complex subunit 8 [Apis laboriosa]|uniref:cytochrome b-c1 complex subunit 8 n=1 Tax=Apis dorsata TaxID=7462 RepID=UPI0003DF4ED9|nr:cytochrome b-c1 complex subunit 8 [Apis dorsata]XP_006615262.1 cytochrome b-c1 complex subunit 8 [Apis dorsata]XP_043803229.1 cytochrome b-c1 complex subunit 8 [Apis laboriosa]